MSTCYNNLFGDVSAKYIIMHQDALRKRTPNTGDAIDAKCVVRTCVGLQSSSSPASFLMSAFNIDKKRGGSKGYDDEFLTMKASHSIPS